MKEANEYDSRNACLNFIITSISCINRWFSFGDVRELYICQLFSFKNEGIHVTGKKIYSSIGSSLCSFPVFIIVQKKRNPPVSKWAMTMGQ